MASNLLLSRQSKTSEASIAEVVRNSLLHATKLQEHNKTWWQYSQHQAHQEKMMNRRNWLTRISGLIAVNAIHPASVSAAGTFPLNKSKQEWRKLLPSEAYQVLFEEGTERAGSSPLNGEKRTGTFICAACNQPLFDSAHKFDSGTGWPSFWQPLVNAIGTSTDYKLVYPRTEYHCSHCGGHQGHVFDDGPKPTGKRYCNNGAALKFVAQDVPSPALRT